MLTVDLASTVEGKWWVINQERSWGWSTRLWLWLWCACPSTLNTVHTAYSWVFRWVLVRSFIVLSCTRASAPAPARQFYTSYSSWYVNWQADGLG
jgi:hypothetical protein